MNKNHYIQKVSVQLKIRSPERGFYRFFAFFLHFCLLIALSFNNSCFSQITFNSNVSSTQLVQTIVGAGYTVSNIKLNCPDSAIGLFTNVTSNIGITDGIMLSSGAIRTANGPNNSASAGVNNGTTGDFDLDQLSGSNTYDACALEFDLIPACDTLRINYVFASEEYPEYVNKQFNDVFAFYISGPGIIGTQNIAVVPSTSLPVAINNINAGNNSQYFINNTGGATVQYDGFTKPLEAKAIVIPCELYHLKLVIADVLDGIFDSGVFIKGNSIDCSPISYNDPASNINAVKNCSPGGFTFCRTGDTTQPFVVKYQISGTAVNGVDYVTIPDSVVIPSNQSCYPVNIVPIIDTNQIGIKTVKIIYQYGNCVRYDTIVLKISDPTPINAGPDVNLCSGDTVHIGNSPINNFAYSWQTTNGLNNSTISNPQLTLTNNTNSDIIVNYVLAVNNPQLGACILKDSLKVTINALPKATFIYQPDYCTGSNVSLTDNSTASNGKNISSWYWNFGNNLFSTQNNPSITYTTAGTYTVALSVTDNSGCTGDTSEVLTIWPAPAVNFSATTKCVGDTVKFLDQSTLATGTILQSIWDFGDSSPLTSGNTSSHVYSGTATTYTVQLIVSSDKNCVSIGQKTVNLYQKPIANFSSTPVCIYNNMLFANQSTGNINTWDFGDGNTSSVNNPKHQFSAIGMHQITLISKNNYGCADTAVKSFMVYDQPKFNFVSPDTAGCAIFCAQFQSQAFPTSDTIVSWDWGFDNGDIAQGTSPLYCYQSNGIYSPKLIATTNHGCKDTLVRNSYITVQPKPTADFTLDTYEISIFQPFIKVNNTSSPDVVNWWWDFGDSTSIMGPGPFNHEYQTVGDYTVKLKVENNYGCTDSTTKRVGEKFESAVFIPNTFTPNDDGLNETFTPYATGAFEKSNFLMYIFDRWGSLIYKTDNLVKGWDGRYKGRICQQDVYVYQVSFFDKVDGTNLGKYRGTVTLLK